MFVRRSLVNISSNLSNFTIFLDALTQSSKNIRTSSSVIVSKLFTFRIISSAIYDSRNITLLQNFKPTGRAGFIITVVRSLLKGVSCCAQVHTLILYWSYRRKHNWIDPRTVSTRHGWLREMLNDDVLTISVLVSVEDPGLHIPRSLLFI